MAEATKREAARPLDAPGERGRARRREAMLRVDHAGEFGAVQIYRGQRAVFARAAGKERTRDLIAAMETGEAEHLKTFDAMVRARGVRPTALAPAWAVAGYALGAATALLGEKAAHACTAAVEEVIAAHYAAQAAELANDPIDGDAELRVLAERFGAEEAGHRATALAEGAEEAPGYALLSAAIKFGCRAAIAISERV
ncbi:MAG: demethoxyubiquinone hydroxylase family protein [Hyphomonadaceae bacterium]